MYDNIKRLKWLLKIFYEEKNKEINISFFKKRFILVILKISEK